MSTLTESLQPLYDRLNSIFLRREDQCEDHCVLCDDCFDYSLRKSHIQEEKHLTELISTVTQLVNAIFSPGIILRENANDIYCHLCEEHVSDLFDSNFHGHISSSGHRFKVDQYRISEQEELKAFCDFEVAGVMVRESNFVEKLSQAVVIVSDDSYNCVACDCKFADQLQLSSHIEESDHLKWVVGQLMKVADKVGLATGIVIRDGSFFCVVCDHKLGNGLATAEAYHHVKSSSTLLRHQIREFKDKMLDAHAIELEPYEFDPFSNIGAPSYYDGLEWLHDAVAFERSLPDDTPEWLDDLVARGTRDDDYYDDCCTIGGPDYMDGKEPGN